MNRLEANRELLKLVSTVVETDEQDIIQDFVPIITSFCARLYGKRSSRDKK